MTKDQKAEQAAHDAVRRGASAALPGQNTALPEGALSRTHEGVQGDEHRDLPHAPSKPPGFDKIEDTVADYLKKPGK